MSRSLRTWLLCGTLLLTLSPLLSSCNLNRGEKKLAEDAQQLEGENFDTDLRFNSVVLEDFNPKGQLWWRVKAEQATYSRDQKVARVTKPNGELFQDGKAIIKVSGEGGEVLKDGEKVFLRGNIQARDLRNGLVLKGTELEWQPQNNLVLIRNNISGTRDKVTAAATNGKYFTRDRRLELDGKVKADSKDPDMRFNTERLVWFVDQQRIVGERPLTAERLENNVVSDRAKAETGDMDIKTRIVTLRQNAQLDIKDPASQVLGNLIVWNVKDRMVTSSQPITMNSIKDNVTLTGNQGELNLKTRILTLVGDVRGAGGPRQARVSSDRLVWNAVTQQFQADGNVNYQQAKPPLNLTGPRATGALKEQQVVVSGGRVVTQFIP